jgi:hypothetical protein
MVAAVLCGEAGIIDGCTVLIEEVFCSCRSYYNRTVVPIAGARGYFRALLRSYFIAPVICHLFVPDTFLFYFSCEIEQSGDFLLKRLC